MLTGLAPLGDSHGEKLHFCLKICSFKRIYNLAYNSVEENKERRFNMLAQMNGISSLFPI